MSFYETTIAPPKNCGCICHSSPGVNHIVACCNAPAYDSIRPVVNPEFFYWLLGSTKIDKK